MPLHDWTRVDDGIFHDFHLAWIAEIRRDLNGGLLPEGYFALAEQVAGIGNPDVLALHNTDVNGDDSLDGHMNGTYTSRPTEEVAGTALLTAPPHTRISTRADNESYTRRQRQLTIRHISGDRIVALIEIVSAGNKSNNRDWFAFIDKVLASLYNGVHLLLVDVHPPTRRDPAGIHGDIWGELTGETFELPADADRTLAAYSAGPVKAAFIEPVAVGQSLRAMPLFLSRDGVGYIEVPLESTYIAAFKGLPSRYRQILNAS